MHVVHLERLFVSLEIKIYSCTYIIYTVAFSRFLVTKGAGGGVYKCITN